MIAGLVLCGGAGRRMGGVDKGLCPLHELPLAWHVAGRFAPQVDALWVSANRHRARYAALGEVVADREAWAGMGPLAGIASCAERLPASCSALAVVPCDTPLLPRDLVVRLQDALAAAPQLDAAYAHSPDGPQYAMLLVRRPALAGLPDYLAQGGRALRGWLDTLVAQAVFFDDEAAFANANDAQALARLARVAGQWSQDGQG